MSESFKFSSVGLSEKTKIYLGAAGRVIRYRDAWRRCGGRCRRLRGGSAQWSGRLWTHCPPHKNTLYIPVHRRDTEQHAHVLTDQELTSVYCMCMASAGKDVKVCDSDLVAGEK